MQAPAAEAPQQEGIDGAEGHLAALGALAQIRDVLQKPGPLGGREIGVDHQTGARAHMLASSPRRAARAGVGGAAALPHDGRGQRRAAGAVPRQRRLALVGHTDRRDLRGGGAGAGHRLARTLQRGRPQVFGAMLDPAGVGIVLREGTRRRGDGRPCVVEEDGA